MIMGHPDDDLERYAYKMVIHRINTVRFLIIMGTLIKISKPSFWI